MHLCLSVIMSRGREGYLEVRICCCVLMELSLMFVKVSVLLKEVCQYMMQTAAENDRCCKNHSTGMESFINRKKHNLFFVISCLKNVCNMSKGLCVISERLQLTKYDGT